MSWHVSGTITNPCSCKVGCPCMFGETEADQGWCSAVLVFDIRDGSVDGVEVSGTRVAMVGDWPSGFLAGNGTGRIYFDSAMSPEQQNAVEQILLGKRGGPMEAIAPLVTKLLPSRRTTIQFRHSPEETRATVGDFGEMVMRPLRGTTGEITRVLHGAAAIRDNVILGRGTGTRWRDPEMRQWESAGHGEQSEFDWQG